jgi:hypothetical protein
MLGHMTLREVLAHRSFIRREFGSLCLVRCLLAVLSGRRTSLLVVALGLEDA